MPHVQSCRPTSSGYTPFFLKDGLVSPGHRRAVDPKDPLGTALRTLIAGTRRDRSGRRSVDDAGLRRRRRHPVGLQGHRDGGLQPGVRVGQHPASGRRGGVHPHPVPGGAGGGVHGRRHPERRGRRRTPGPSRPRRHDTGGPSPRSGPGRPPGPHVPVPRPDPAQGTDRVHGQGRATGRSRRRRSACRPPPRPPRRCSASSAGPAPGPWSSTRW